MLKRLIEIFLNPKDADAYCNRGLTYVEKGEYDKAIEDCSKAIALNPKYANAYLGRGASYAKKGEYDKAIEDINMGIKLKPELQELYQPIIDGIKSLGY